MPKEIHHDWEDQHILAKNREPARATLSPYADEKTALAGERGASPRFRLLNGVWSFDYAISPMELSRRAIR